MNDDPAREPDTRNVEGPGRADPGTPAEAAAVLPAGRTLSPAQDRGEHAQLAVDQVGVGRWLCGCPAVGRIPNRADRRRARRLGLPEPQAVKHHLAGCPNRGPHLVKAAGPDPERRPA